VKKFNIILLALVMCAMLAVPALAQFQSGNDADGWSPWRMDSYVKDYVMTFKMNGADSIDTLKYPKRASFIVPEAAEVMRVWISTWDSCATVDTIGGSGKGYIKAILWARPATKSDTDTVASWAARTTATRLRAHQARVFTFPTSVLKRQFAKGEQGFIQIDTIGGPTNKPSDMVINVLFRPKSKPPASDYYNRQ
jgi:hypothetical protein